MSVRGDFEKRFLSGTFLKRGAEDRYYYEHAQQLWEAYQAGHADAVPNVDELAQFIRDVDGDHRMSVGALAEQLCAFLAARQEKGNG